MNRAGLNLHRREKNMPIPEFQLTRNAFGLLVLTKSTDEVYEGVIPIRSFPLQFPDRYIAIITHDGHEIAWIDNLLELSDGIRQMVKDELESRQFMPKIQCILNVSSFVTPCTWEVITDKGRASFVLLEEEDIHHINSNASLITDSHGTPFFIQDIRLLDKHSKTILDRFSLASF